MHVGKRVGQLRSAHGESLREAAMRTGVSHTTIARIEKGEVTGSFHSTLLKIAEGYGVKMEFLLTGRDPRQDFEFSIRRLSPEERSRLYFASPRTRTRMVLDFLIAEYPNEFSLGKIADQAGIDRHTFQEMLQNWFSSDIPEAYYTQVAHALSRMTGIHQHWFHRGSLGTEEELQMAPELLESYAGLMRKAHDNGITPEVLDMAIDLLILKQATN